MTFQIKSLAGFFAALCLLISPLAIKAGDHWHSATQMGKAANDLIATLNAEQRKTTVFPLQDSARTTWSNLPVIMVRPGGMLIRDMNDSQRIAVHGLLRASMSSQGYAKFAGIMRLEDQSHSDAMAQLENSPDPDPMERSFAQSFDSQNYAVSIFGDPDSKHWGWKIAGHHAAASFTVSDGHVGFTPTFMGSNPMVVKRGKYTGWMTLPQEGSRGLELMQSLDKEQSKAALMGDEKPADVFEGPGRRASLSSYEGLRASQLSPEQTRLLRALISEYVRNADFDTADAQMALIEQAGWNELWFSWRGPVDKNGLFYYRIHGPRILIEYSRQNENHDHTIVRDPKNDYGEDWLGKHYEEHHPSMKEAMENARRASQ